MCTNSTSILCWIMYKGWIKGQERQENTMQINGTSQECTKGQAHRSMNPSGLGLDLAFSIVSICLIIESLSILIRIIPHKSLHTGTNLIIVSHALAALCASTSSLVRLVMDLGKVSSTTLACKLSNGLTFYGALLQLANTFLLALERLYAMKYPLDHQRHLSKRNVLIIISLQWLPITLITLIVSVVFFYSVDNVTVNNCPIQLVRNTWFSTFFSIILTCLVFSFLYTTFYTMILLKRNLRILTQCVPQGIDSSGRDHNGTECIEPKLQHDNARESNLRNNVRLTAVCIIPAIAYVLSYLPVLVLRVMCAMEFTICWSPQGAWFLFPVLLLNTINVTVHCYRLKIFQSLMSTFRSQTLCAHRVHTQSEPDSRIATVGESAFHLQNDQTLREDIFIVMREFSNSNNHVRCSPPLPSTSTPI